MNTQTIKSNFDTMRFLNVFFIISLFCIVQLSCQDKNKKTTKTDEEVVQGVASPESIVTDTIKDITVSDTIVVPDRTDKEMQEVVGLEPVKEKETSNVAAKASLKDNDYDPNNSGFFDEYSKTYEGDPNKDLKPITRVVKSNVEEVRQQKAELEKKIQELEEKNRQQQLEQDRINREIEENNKKALDRAKELQEQQKDKNSNL